MATPSFSDYLPHLAYWVEGIITCLTNGLLLLAILRDSSFRKRKELLIIAGLAGTDTFYGLGTMLYGIYRSSVLWQGQQNDYITKWQCVILPATIMSYIGGELTSVMNVILSIDRLMAVVSPAKYRLLDRRYAFKVTILVVLFGALSVAAMLLTTHFQTDTTPTAPKLCTTGTVFPASYNLFHTTFVAGAGFTSVVIYIGVFFAYRRATKVRVSPNDQSHDSQQHRLTVTLGIITTSTLFLYIIPFLYLSVCALMDIVPAVPNLIGALFRCSTIINVLIYVYRQKEIRGAMWTFIKCKKGTTTTSANGIVK